MNFQKESDSQLSNMDQQQVKLSASQTNTQSSQQQQHQGSQQQWQQQQQPVRKQQKQQFPSKGSARAMNSKRSHRERRRPNLSVDSSALDTETTLHAEADSSSAGPSQSTSRKNRRNPPNTDHIATFNGTLDDGYLSDNTVEAARIAATAKETEITTTIKQASPSEFEDQLLQKQRDTASNRGRNRRRRSSLRLGQVVKDMINFSFAPRNHGRDLPGSSGNGGFLRKDYWRYDKSKPHNLQKSNYIHANYRFVVFPVRDYTLNLTDPDVLVPWSDIFQILAQPSFHSHCPVCLSEHFVAPRMTPCGHVICLPCAKRYFNDAHQSPRMFLKIKQRRECPICTDTFTESDLKPFKITGDGVQHEYREGNEISFRLLCREQGSIYSIPADADFKLDHDEVANVNNMYAMQHAPLVMASDSYISKEMHREIDELEASRIADMEQYDDDGTVYVESQTAIEKSLKDLTNIISAGKKRSKKMMSRATGSGESSGGINLYSSPSDSVGSEDATNNNDATHSQLQSERDSRQRSPAELNQRWKTKTQHRSTQQEKSDHAYYFYQSIDGRPYFLSPLDIRILRQLFGAYSSFPPYLNAKICSISHGLFVDDAFRKRFKYLGNLPYGSEVSFVDCDWQDSIVPKQILAHFRPELDIRRRHLRDKRELEESNRLQALQQEEAKIMDSISQSFSRGFTIASSSPRHGYASYIPAELADKHRRGGSKQFSSNKPSHGARSSQERAMSATSAADNDEELQFPDIFAAKESDSADGAEGMEESRTSGLSRIAMPTVWGKTLPYEMPQRPLPDEVNDEVDEDNWEQRILQAQEQQELNGRYRANGTGDSASSGNRKGKGRKKLVLMSSGLQRP